MQANPAIKAPDTVLVTLSVVVLAVVLTWLVPPGAFQKQEVEVPGVGTRQVVVPGTYAPVDGHDKTVVERVAHSVGMLFTAPIRGLIGAVDIIAFVLLIGGTFTVLQQTGALEAALRRLVQRAQSSKVVERLLIPMFMLIFAFGGATFGMAEEVIPFILIFVPLALALGYDSITGMAIPFIGAASGFAGAFLNPFTVGIAQGIAGVPLFSGMGFRLGLWACVTLLAIAFVTWYAHRVKQQPQRSPVFAADEVKRREGLHLYTEAAPLTGRQIGVLGVFFAGLAVLVWTVQAPERGGLGWYIIELAGLFVAMGVAMGLVGGLSARQISEAFQTGARDFVVTALLIGLARGILIVMEDGQIIDTILNAAAGLIGNFGPSVAAGVMFACQTAINFFVPSGSGQAALTMPVMAPLADLVGVSRQTAVVAFQMGDGFTNMIIPTSGILMGALALAGIPWTTWARWVAPLQLLFFLLGLGVLAVAVAVGY